MKITEWNINSVRHSITHIIKFILEYNADMMYLHKTKTKTENEYFPS